MSDKTPEQFEMLNFEENSKENSEEDKDVGEESSEEKNENQESEKIELKPKDESTEVLEKFIMEEKKDQVMSESKVETEKDKEDKSSEDKREENEAGKEEVKEEGKEIVKEEGKVKGKEEEEREVKEEEVKVGKVGEGKVGEEVVEAEKGETIKSSKVDEHEAENLEKKVSNQEEKTKSEEEKENEKPKESESKLEKEEEKVPEKLEDQSTLIRRSKGKSKDAKVKKSNTKVSETSDKIHEESKLESSKEKLANKKRDNISEKNKRLLKVILLLTYASVITFLVTKYFIFSKESLESSRKLRYWLTLYNESRESMADIKNVLDFVGHEQTTNGRDFDIIWTIRYPFVQMQDIIKDLPMHKKINHIPGSYTLLMKPYYSISAPAKFIPLSFMLPHDNVKFKEYVKQNPQKMFVETEVETGHIQVRKSQDLRLIKEKSFIQEFIDKPLLVDGRIFDIGFYVVITSVDPLRVYIYDGEAQVRLCQERYHPFNSKNPRKYNLLKNSVPIWNIPELSKFHQAAGGGIKASLEVNLKNRGFDVVRMWKGVEEAIVSLIVSMEPHILYIMNDTKMYDKKFSFFEIFRFDFTFDNKFNPYLTNVVGSPSFYPDEKFLSFNLPFNQMMYNVLNLVGLGHQPFFHRDGTTPAADYIVIEKDVAIDPYLCSRCHSKIEKSGCELCFEPQEIDKLQRIHAFTENFNRGSMRRIFPVKKHYNDNFLSQTSVRNKLMILWYREQCKKNPAWC